MTKKATLTDVSSGYQSSTTLNDNYTKLNDQFDNTLSLDGSTPNAMNADIDLNDNDLINVKDLYADTIVLNGVSYSGFSITPEASAVNIDTFTGDASTTAFVLANNPGSKSNTVVIVSGVLQHQDTYSVSGTTLTFSEAPPNGAAIEVRSTTYLASTDTASALTYNGGSASEIDRTLTEKLSDFVSVKDFGAAGNGSTDDTTAFANALATGKDIFLPEGDYLITDKLQYNIGQAIWGQNKHNTKLKIYSTSFNMSATAVLEATGGEPGGHLKGFTIDFDQPTSPSLLSEIHQYPVAIKVDSTPRFTLENIRIEGAWNGVSLDGNSGGLWVLDVEVGAANKAFFSATGGSLDFCHFMGVHVWPFGFSPDAKTVVYTNTPEAFNLGRVDGLDFTNVSVFRSSITLEDCFGTLNGIKLDGYYSNFSATDCKLAISGLYASSDDGTDNRFNIVGGSCEISSSWWLMHTSGTQAPVTIGAGAEVTMVAPTFLSGSPDAPSIELNGTSANLNLVAPVFAFGTNTTRTEPFIKQTVGRLSVVAATFFDIGTGSGDCLEVTVDDWHNISISQTLGWGYTLPASKSSAYYDIRGVTNRLDMFNNTSMRWQDSGGTARNVLQVSSADHVNLRQAGADFRILDITGASVYAQVNSSGVLSTRVTQPLTDNTYTLGTGSFRWTTVYATTGTINTSDRREKKEIQPISVKEQHVGRLLKPLLIKYKYKDGEKIHFGVIAQEVIGAFHKAGLDYNDYAIIEEQDGKLGVRYTDLFALILGSM